MQVQRQYTNVITVFSVALAEFLWRGKGNFVFILTFYNNSMMLHRLQVQSYVKETENTYGKLYETIHCHTRFNVCYEINDSLY